MKALTLILILLFLSLPALAQTQTICQVYGNQINCTSTSPPPPVALAVVPPPQPSLSPELIRALAEKRAQEFAAAESARQAAVEKFEAELSTPDVWTEIRNGGQFHVRMLKEHIYLQLIPGPNAPTGTHTSVECQLGDGVWVCTSYSDSLLQQKKWYHSASYQPSKWCHFERSSKLTTISLDRIEWEVDSPDKPEDLDVDKCLIKRTTHKTLTLIPRQVPKP